ncbi:MAG: HAD-IB family hydrolase [Phycisphaerae bacterium]
MCSRDREPEESSGAAAFFDVDGTLVSTHIVHQYVHLRRVLARRCRGTWGSLIFPLWLLGFYVKCMHYIYLDRISRTRMNVVFYRNYQGLASEQVRQAAEDCFRNVLKPHLFDQAAGCVDQHLRAGRRVVLVTGSIDFMIEPLAQYLSERFHAGPRVDLLARTLEERRGVFTGALDGPPIGGREKAQVIERFAATQGIDLASSYAYGDSIADLPMLETVGHPIVVNADRELAKRAASRGWPSRSWSLSSNGR